MDPEQLRVIQIIVGSLLCAGGWALAWLGARLLGLGIGMGIGFAIAALVCLVVEAPPDTQALVVMAGTFIGAVAGLFMVKFLTVAVFALAGFLFGLLLGRVGSEWVAEAQGLAYQFTPSVGLAIAGCAGAGAVIAALLRKFVIIGITSIVGAAYLVQALEALQRDRRVWMLALAVVAIVWQIIVSRAIAGKKKPA